jgi:hypothetical protein
VPVNEVLLRYLMESGVNYDLDHPNQDKHTKIDTQSMLVKKFEQNTHLLKIIVLGMLAIILTFFKIIIK